MPETQNTRDQEKTPEEQSSWSALEQFDRECARRMIQAAIEAEVEQFVTDYARLE